MSVFRSIVNAVFAYEVNHFDMCRELIVLGEPEFIGETVSILV